MPANRPYPPLNVSIADCRSVHSQMARRTRTSSNGGLVVLKAQARRGAAGCLAEPEVVAQTLLVGRDHLERDVESTGPEADVETPAAEGRVVGRRLLDDEEVDAVQVREPVALIIHLPEPVLAPDLYRDALLVVLELERPRPDVPQVTGETSTFPALISGSARCLGCCKNNR